MKAVAVLVGAGLYFALDLVFRLSWSLVIHPSEFDENLWKTEPQTLEYNF